MNFSHEPDFLMERIPGTNQTFKKDVMVKLTPHLAKILYSTRGNAPSQSVLVVCMSQQNTGQERNFLTKSVICSVIQIVLAWLYLNSTKYLNLSVKQVIYRFRL